MYLDNWHYYQFYQYIAGVSHADELFNFFSMPLATDKITPADLSVSKRLVEYWVNFAHTGCDE